MGGEVSLETQAEAIPQEGLAGRVNDVLYPKSNGEPWKVLERRQCDYSRPPSYIAVASL